MSTPEIQNTIHQLWETGSKDRPEPRHANTPEEESEHPGYPVLLDSLASVLVSRARGESIAVGAQLDSRNLTLILATNGKVVPEETSRHAEMLLKRLRQLGRDVESCRLEKTGRENFPRGNRSLRLDELPSQVRGNMQAFESRVYRFSLCKLWRRLNKPYKPPGKPTAIPRSEFFYKHVSILRQKRPDEVMRNLKEIPQFVWHLYAAVKSCRMGKGLSGADEERYLLLMSLSSREISRRVQRIFAVKGWQRRLRCKLATEAKDFPFDRFLQSLTILPSASTRLIDTAAARNFYLRYLDPGTTSIAITRLENETHILHPQPHPELLLALHFIRQRRQSERREAAVPPLALSYIGTSRLSCLSCWMFLQSLQTVDILLATRGTHGKAYFPWVFPEEQLLASGLRQKQRDAVVKSFAEKVTWASSRRIDESLERGALGDDEKGDGDAGGGKWSWADEDGDEVVDEGSYEWDIGGGSLPDPAFVMAVFTLLMMVTILVAMWR